MNHTCILNGNVGFNMRILQQILCRNYVISVNKNLQKIR